MAQRKNPKRNRPSQTRPRPKVGLAVEILERRDLLSGLLALEHLAAGALTADAQTFHIRFSPNGSSAAPQSTAGPTGTTPAQIKQAYGFNQISFAGGTVPANGSGTTIAIVDAFDDPNIANDLHQFDQTFGLPDPPTFTKENQNGGSALPAPNSGWITEIALDVEWSHAIAPGANILLVESNDDSNTNLYDAVAFAAKQPGVVAVSMSWGGGEDPSQLGVDSIFQTPAGHPGVTFIAASGDSGAPPIYPASSPNVLAVGGTTLNLDASGNVIASNPEAGWSGSGGGISTVEVQPSYQSGLVIHNGTSLISAGGMRTNPDVAYDADPNTGFPVYDTYNNPLSAPWGQWGGTSDAAPQWAALIAITDQGRALSGVGPLDGPTQTIPTLYGLPASDFTDVTTGTSTGTPNYTAGPGYDLVTGRGSPLANQIVATLDTHFAVTGPLAATAGSAFTITLTALDGGNHTLTAYAGTVHFSSSDNQAVLPANAALTNGVGVFTVTLKTAGSQTLTAADTLASSLSGSLNVSVSPIAATHFGVNAPPGATVGKPFGFTVIAEDPYNNATTIYNGSVHLTSSDPVATLSANGSLTGGVGVFSATLQTLGTQTLSATDTTTSSMTGASLPISVSLAATHFAINSPANATAGSPFNFTVTALDANNGVATGYTGTIHFISGDSQATMPADGTLTKGSGVFSVILKTAGGQTLAATDITSASITGASNSTLVSPIAATHFGFIFPGNIGVATAFTFTVLAEDPFNNTATSFNGSVHFTSGDSLATLPANSTLVNGIGVFNATFRSGGNQSLTVTNPVTLLNLADAPGSPASVGAGPVALAVGDFNGDGNVDMAVANFVDSSITILLGAGDGSFTTGETDLVGADPFSIATADLNHDGKLDLVVGDFGQDTVTVLLGNGNGTFGPPTDYPVGVYPGQVVIGDLNGDGIPDLAVANSGDGTVSVLLGKGDGTFAPATVTQVGSQPFGLVEGDFNHDGKLDLAVADYGNSSVVVLLGKGNGSFSAPTNYLVGYYPASVVVGDFNGDGKPDLAVTNYGSNTVNVLLGTGSGTFTAGPIYDVGAGPWGLATADLSGDGKPDLVTSNLYSGDLTVLLGDGNGTFSNEQTISFGGSSPYGVNTGDFNNDNIPDIAVANEGSDSVNFFLNQEMAGSALVPVGAAAANHFIVTAPSNAAAGSATRFTVAAYDQFNNLATAYTGTVLFTSSDSGATLPAASVLTNGKGIFSATLQTFGTQSITASDASNGNFLGTSNSINVTLPASHFMLVVPAGAIAGGAFALTVTALDASNNTVSGYSGTVHFTSSDNQASLPTNATLAGGVGILSATLKTAGNQTLLATDTAASTLTGASNTISVSPTLVSHFAVTGAPTNATAGALFRFTVTAEDPYANTVSGYGGTVSFTSSDKGANTLLPTQSTLVGGVGTFSATLTTAGNQTVSATDTTTSSINGATGAIDVNPATASHLTVTAPNGAIIGAAANFTVTALDAFNNTASNYSGSLNFTSSDHAATLPAISPLTSGIGTFSATLQTLGLQALTATDGVTSSLTASSGPISVSFAATHFLVNGPATVTAGNTGMLTVTAQDQFGDTVVADNGAVQFSGSDTQAVLPSVATLANGVGTFNVTLKTAGNQSLTATDVANGTLSGVSNAIAVSPALATHFAISGVPAGITAGSPFAFTALAQDPFGNKATTYGGTVTFSTSDKGLGTSLPAASRLIAGIGTFTATLTTSGNQTLSATDSTTTSITGTSGAVTVSAAGVSHFGILAPSGAIAGTTSSFTVKALDPFNNTATTYGGIVHFTSSDSAANLPGNNLLTSGVGTFSATLHTLGKQTLTATDAVNSSLSAASNAISVSFAASHYLISGPASVTAGNAFMVTVTAEDQLGDTVVAYSGTIHLSSGDSQAALPGDATLVNGVGAFTVNLKTAGTQAVSAADTATSSITGTTSPIAVASAVVAHFEVVGPATAAAGIPVTFTVMALDLYANTVPGYSGTVHFSSSDSGAMLPANATLTSGLSAFSATLQTPGDQALSATDNVIGSVSGTATVHVEIPASHFQVGVPSGAVAGTAFTFTVTALSSANTPATGYTGTVTFSSSDNAAAFQPTTGTMTASVGIFTVTLKTAGNRTLTVTDNNSSGLTGTITGTSATTMVSAAAATHFVVSAPTSATASAPFAITVTAQDDFGNADQSFAGPVKFNSSDTNSSVVLPGTYTFGAADQGHHVFAGGVVLYTTGPQTVTASTTVPGITGTSNTINVNPLGANHFVVTATSAVVAGNAFTFTVAAKDQFGNTVPSYNGTVAFSSSDGGSGVALPSSSILTSGVGTFTATLVTAGARTLTATDTGNVTGSAVVNVTAATASQFAVVAPSPEVEGGTFGVTVTAKDPYGNTDTQYSNFVTLTDSITNATFSKTLTGGSGIISVTLNSPGNRVLAASDTSIFGTSNTFTITAATHFVVSAASSQTAGGSFNVTVTAKDDFGNTDTVFGGTVGFTSTDTTATFVPAASTLSGGVGVFSATLHKVGAQTVTASAGSLSGSSNAITVSAATASHFAVSTMAATMAGTPFSVTVTALDPFGNTAQSYNGSVAFASSDSNATLPNPGPNGTGLANGVGVFTATMKTAGNQTLTATDTVTGSIKGTAGPITVSPSIATHFAVTAPAATTAGNAFGFTVTARDAFNNTATSYTGTVAFASNDGSAALPSANSLAAGFGIFSATLKTAGNRLLTATDTSIGTMTGASSTIAVTGAAATHFVLSAPGTATAGGAFSFTVTARDAFNNTATSYSGTTLFSSSDPAATVPSGITFANGVGLFSATLKTAGNQTLVATDKNTSSITGSTSQIAVTSGAATHFTVAAPPTATAGSPVRFTVTAQDAFNNTATAYSGTVTLTSSDSGAGAGLPAPTPLTGGIGTFSATLVTAGSRTLSATDAAGTPALAGTSNTISVTGAAATHFAVTAPTGVSAGIGFVLTVQALDPYNNAAISYAGTVTFSSTDTAPALPTASVLSSGVGSFSATLATLGTQTITAADKVASTLTGTSSTITVSRPPATHFTIKTRTNRVTAGVAVTVTVTALDQFNHTAVGYTGNVSFSTTDSAATVGQYLPSPPDPLTGGVGVFTITLVTAGSQSLTVTDSASLSGSLTLTVVPGAAKTLLVTPPTNMGGSPNVVIANRAFTFTVTAQDQFGNTATGYAGTVQISASDGAATLPSAKTLTSGVGTFTATLSTVGGQTLTATDTVTSTITGTALVMVPVTLSLPTRLSAAPGGTITVPISVNALSDPSSSAHQSGLSGGDFVLYYNPSVFSVTNADISLGTIGIATIPGDGFSPANPNGWSVDPNAATPGYLNILLSTTSQSNVITGTGGGTLVTVNFHVLPGAASGPSNIDLAADTGGTGNQPVTYLNDGVDDFQSNVGYNLLPAPQDNTVLGPPYAYTGTDPLDSSVAISGLVVSGFTPTPTGFTVAFNKPFDPTTVNLYTTGSLPDDVTLTPSNQISIRGSVLFNAADTSLTFVKTATAGPTGTFNPASGILAAGVYTVTLRSFSTGTSGFQDLLGNPLDGAANGSPGTNYVATFTVTAPAVAVGIPDFARGFSNTDAIFLSNTLVNGSTFKLIYTNPAVTPTTGTATVTFSTTAATLQSNIQNALTSGALATQIGTNSATGIPNSVALVTTDTAAGANVTVTFQSALAQATNELLSSTTPGVSITMATINVPNNIPGSGIPIALSSGLNVTSGSFTLQYNPALLNITGAVSKIAGATFTLVSNNTTTGTAVLSLSSPTRISTTATAITIGSLLATVPVSATASYGAKQLLHFSSEQLSGIAGPIAATNQDGIEVAAYFGDVTETGGPLTLQDASTIALVSSEVPNTTAKTIPGFAAYPNLDPVIIGDVSLQGLVNSTDSGAMLQEIGGTARVTIPYAPIGLQTTLAPRSSAQTLSAVQSPVATSNPPVIAAPTTDTSAVVLPEWSNDESSWSIGPLARNKLRWTVYVSR